MSKGFQWDNHLWQHSQIELMRFYLKLSPTKILFVSGFPMILFERFSPIEFGSISRGHSFPCNFELSHGICLLAAEFLRFHRIFKNFNRPVISDAIPISRMNNDTISDALIVYLTITELLMFSLICSFNSLCFVYLRLIL